MPKYTYPLANGKALTLEGDTQPTDAEVESIAHEQGVSLVAADAKDDPGAVFTTLQNKTLGTVKDVGVGALKGAADTAIGLGRLVHKIPGVSSAVDALYGAAGAPVDSAKAFEGHNAEAGFETAPTNTPQKLGKIAEQGAEFMVPAGATRAAATKLLPKLPGVVGRLLPLAAADAASSAGVAAAHGGDPKTAAMMGAALPVAGEATGALGAAAHSTAVRFVRAGIKPTVTEMKQTAGASKAGIDNMANRLAEYLLKRKIITPEQAQAIINGAETEIQSMVGSQPTDAPARAARYLKALERSAAKQGLGADDVSTLRGAAEELVNGPMGESVATQTTSMQPGKILQPNGQPTMVPVTTSQTTRALRPDVPADEALDSARASSKWATNKQWGEQKGSSVSAKKAVEEAQRDAVKAAVPESRPVFNEYSQAIKARDVLTRKQFREGNRDVVGMVPQIMGAAEVATGKKPILALASQYLRSNQMRAGMWTDKLANAIKNEDVQTASEILARLGVSLGSDSNDPLEHELLSRVR